MPVYQVTFQAIRDVVSQFLAEENIGFTDMQPTHLGQAYVRFTNALDRDRLISHGAYIFGDVSISFVEHNKGRNWRAVNFNKECWLLLMGHPPDYREDEFMANTINTFGRVMYWVDNRRHLSRILVRARVIDFESIPQFLVLTECGGSRVISGLCNVRFYKEICLVGYPRMRTLPLTQTISCQGGRSICLDLVKMDQALLPNHQMGLNPFPGGAGG
jgi:hypothetical protein